MLALMLGCAQPSHGLTQKHVADGALLAPVAPIFGVQPKPSPGQHPTCGRLEQKACKDLLFRAHDDTAVEDVCDAGGGHICGKHVDFDDFALQVRCFRPGAPFWRFVVNSFLRRAR